jgi:preprotein translocase subunit YajC
MILLGTLGGLGGGEILILLLPVALIFLFGYFVGLAKGRKENQKNK